MVKSRLPREWELKLPPEIVHVIYSFLPHNPKSPAPSPQLQKELQKLQSGDKKTSMYLKGLDDFVLD
jgi:hypothetical protein